MADQAEKVAQLVRSIVVPLIDFPDELTISSQVSDEGHLRVEVLFIRRNPYKRGVRLDNKRDIKEFSTWQLKFALHVMVQKSAHIIV